MSKDEGPRWTGLVAEGSKVVLVGREGNWTVIQGATDTEAQHIVRELSAWAKHLHDVEEYKSLCRS